MSTKATAVGTTLSFLIEKNTKKAADRTVCQRHCEEVYTDLEETKETQESRMEYFTRKKRKSTKATAVGATLSFSIKYRPEEDVKRIPACIAHIVGDTVGDITGMGAGSLRFVC